MDAPEVFALQYAEKRNMVYEEGSEWTWKPVNPSFSRENMTWPQDDGGGSLSTYTTRPAPEPEDYGKDD